jgi:hypothetical protein
VQINLVSSELTVPAEQEGMIKSKKLTEGRIFADAVFERAAMKSIVSAKKINSDKSFLCLYTILLLDSR